MKRNNLVVLCTALCGLFLLASGCNEAVPVEANEAPEASLALGKQQSCTTIQSGELLTSDGRVITPGYDEWGYNYQARLFNGMYCDAYWDAAWCQSYADVKLSMKWNDAWLDNQDCDGDNLLDRHYGFPSYIGSGAWQTNHMAGEYEDNGKVCHWTYFAKFVAAPSDANLVAGEWYSADGALIGPEIWDEFAVIQEVVNDPCDGLHGIQVNGEAPTGFGFYKP